MPSNKTLSVLIVCLSLVLSVWIFSNDDTQKNASVENSGDSEVVPAIQIAKGVNDDWKKILSSVDKKTPYEDLTQNLAEDNDSTLTDQLSKDFMSQYLLAIKSGETINKETANVIARNTLSLPDYNISPVKYIRQNLKIIPQGDIITMRTYKEALNEGLETMYYSINDDPLNTVVNALNTENETELKKLDPIIKVNKSMVKYLLSMKVPEKAVSTHLELLNLSSAILFDLEGMRVGLEDPIKIFISISNYPQNLINFADVVNRMNQFLINNT